MMQGAGEAVRKRGRPKKPFSELSVITQRQNAKKLCNELSINELGLAFQKSLKGAGYIDASKVVKNIIEGPAIGRDYIKAYEDQKILKRFTSDEALALSMDMKLSRRQYTRMYSGAKKRNSPLYPP